MKKILKFGGSSVGSSERIRQVISIIKRAYDEDPRLGIVVSAFGGATDQLIALGRKAASGSCYKSALDALIVRHKNAARELIPNGCGLEGEFQELEKLLAGVFIIRDLSPKLLDQLMSFGERLSARIISEAIRPLIPEVRYLDARKIIKTDREFGSAQVDFEATFSNIQECLSGFPFMPVITGFIGSSKENEATTLGRGGSDYSAAIIGAGLDVDSIEIWTDVSGMYSADPRIVKDSFPIPEMSYEEAMEMSYFGAKVLHAPTIVPACEKRIPIWIKNTFDPEARGTEISERGAKSEIPICGISSIENASLIRLQGVGIANRLFGALAERRINIILSSQGSSEHSICIAVSSSSVEEAQEAIQKEFALELRAGEIQSFSIEGGFSIVAAVGANLRAKPGIAGRLFEVLGKCGINVSAIAQGSSEINISVAVKNGKKAIRSIHGAFFSQQPVADVFLIGAGLIGSKLLNLIGNEVRVVGIANSRQMVIREEGILLDGWREVLAGGEPFELKGFIERMRSLDAGRAIFVDCTSSQEVSGAYEEILDAGIPVVAANKKANSGSYGNYLRLHAKRGVPFLYSSNVGAGLPMISAIQDLVRSGDRVKKIEAILSGTLSYILHAVEEGKSFQQAVAEAQEKGYAEPDPRDDLSGADVARKLLILCRESGFPLEMEEIAIEPLLPEQAVKEEGKRLRYIASFEGGKARVSLQSVGPQHPFFHLSGNDNVLAVISDFYSESPLVIKGPGAGAAVTAGKVLADLLNAARSRI